MTLNFGRCFNIIVPFIVGLRSNNTTDLAGDILFGQS